MLRWNTTTGSTEVYDGTAWGNIGGGAIISTTAPSAPNPGDLWYDSDDGRLFVYYDDGATSQWVDSSPYGLPTDLTVDGTLSVSGASTFDSAILIDVGGTIPVIPGPSVATFFRASTAASGCQVNIIGGNASTSYLNFGDTDDASVGYLAYDHGTETMRFGVGNNGAVMNLTTSSFTPETDSALDLGSATKRFANIYSADLQLSNEGAANEVDGTWGQYTIQEGEEDLFLINRRNGKTYKFNLTEVA
jgi:hypothetical protein